MMTIDEKWNDNIILFSFLVGGCYAHFWFTCQWLLRILLVYMYGVRIIHYRVQTHIYWWLGWC